MSPATHKQMWTTRARTWVEESLPPEKLLPDTQPSYVSSWVYLLGAVTLSAFVVVIATGVWLGVKGPQWWHTSDVGKYVNSLHLWSVELFMAFMVIHLWAVFFMAAWRGKRALTWVTGALCFLGSIGTALTGYVIQQNFDSQWISTQAKDGLNAVGIGSLFNVMNYGQMLVFHVSLLPVVVGVLIGIHLLMVRRRGVVPPIDAVEQGAEPTAVEAPGPDVAEVTP